MRWLVVFGMIMLVVLVGLTFLDARPPGRADYVAAVVLAVPALLTLWWVPSYIRRTLSRARDTQPTVPSRTTPSPGDPLAIAFGVGLVVAQLVPVFAAAFAFGMGSPLVYAVPFVVGEWLLYRHVLPRPAVVAEARRIITG